MPGRQTAYALLFGSIPLLEIELLRGLHVVNPTVLDLQGHVFQHGRGFTEFAYRGEANQHQLGLLFIAFFVIILLNSTLASAAGWFGGRLADGIKALQTTKSSQ